MKKKINNLKILFHNELNKLKNYYQIKNCKKLLKKNNLKEEWSSSFRDLVNDGLTKLPIKIEIPDIIQQSEFFCENQNYKNFIILENPLPKFDQYGKAQIEININSLIFRKIFSKDLFNLINLYYKKNFWLRNSPVIILDKKNERTNIHDQSFFHLDHCERQLSLVILLNKITTKNTHTEYIKSSNNNSWFLSGHNRKKKAFIKKINEIKKNNSIIKIIGEPGDVFLFDAGNGLHKGIYGDDRVLIHLNFAQMRLYANYDEDFEKKELLKKNLHYNINMDESLKKFLNENSWKKSNFKYLKRFD